MYIQQRYPKMRILQRRRHHQQSTRISVFAFCVACLPLLAKAASKAALPAATVRGQAPRCQRRLKIMLYPGLPYEAQSDRMSKQSNKANTGEASPEARKTTSV
jgi:hypothetical protein